MHWLFLEREGYCSYIMRTRSSQCHSNLIFVTSRKPLDHMMDIYGGQAFDLKTRVDIWIRMDMILLE